jgi:SET domain-containing protein
VSHPLVPWEHPHITVGASDIAGRGAFAAAPIPAGTVLARLDAAAPLIGNHSCDPTLWWADGYTLVARRDLASGEELTHDYATSIDDPAYLLACHCQTYRCRQLISGDDWQIPQLQQRYEGHWTPALQRRIDGAPVA